MQLVPALSKWGGTTVGLTLLAIGGMGLYESFFEDPGHHHHHDAFPGQPAGGAGAGARSGEMHAVAFERRGCF